MEKSYRLPGNNRLSQPIAALAVVALLAGGLFGQGQAEPAQSPKLSAGAHAAEPKAENDFSAKVLELAKTDHIALLRMAMAHYEKNVRDYTGTFYKQERIRGRLGKEQVISFKFKEKPFSVFMEWKENAGPTDRLLYVEGSNDNKMIVHPTGLLSWIKSVERDPRCKAALRWNLHPCDEFGFYHMMQTMLRICETARSKGCLETRYMGLVGIDGRKCAGLELLFALDRESKHQRSVVYIDVEYLLPVDVAGFDWKGNLISRYVFKDLKFNVGLSEQRFTPKANKL